MRATQVFASLIGAALLSGAALALGFSDASLFDACETVTTFEPATPTSSSSLAADGRRTSGSTTADGHPSSEDLTPGVSATDAAPSSLSPGASADDDGLTAVKRIKTCKPSDLSGGVPLLLGLAGGILLAPWVLRLLPPGRYGIAGVEADTTGMPGAAALSESDRAKEELLNEQAGEPL